MAQDAMGRLASITGPQGPTEPTVGGSRGSRSLLTYAYLGDKVWKRWSGNGLETRFFEDGATPQPLYDALGRLRGMRSVDAGNGNPTVADVRYGYDRVGNRTYEQRRHEALTGGASGFRTRTYKSDLLGRLTKWREGGLGADSLAAPAVAPTVTDPTSVIVSPSDGEDWSLDMLGNWENHSVGASPAASDTYTANALNQYTQIDPAGAAPAKPLTFDWIGQLIQDDLKNRKYQWDAFGRLTRVITPGVSPAPDTIVATYRYDAFNRRVEKAVPTAPDATTRYLYDGWRAIEERAVLGSPGSQSEVVRARYGFGLGLDEVVWMDRDLNTGDSTIVDSRYFVAQDALGSAVAATADRTDFAQPLVVAERYTYSAYGKVSIWGGAWSSATGSYGTPRGQTSLIGLPYLYTGQRFDTESGLYYFKNRFYDGENGRFLRRDLLGLSAGPNVYAYVKATAHSARDPLGLQMSGMAQVVDSFSQWNNSRFMQRLNQVAMNQWLATPYSWSSTTTEYSDGTTVTSNDEFAPVATPRYGIGPEGELVQIGWDITYEGISDITVTAPTQQIELQPFDHVDSYDLGPLRLGPPIGSQQAAATKSIAVPNRSRKREVIEGLNAGADALDNTLGLIEALVRRWGNPHTLPQGIGVTGVALSANGVIGRALSAIHGESVSTIEKLQNLIGTSIDMVGGAGVDLVSLTGAEVAGAAVAAPGAFIAGWDVGRFFDTHGGYDGHTVGEFWIEQLRIQRAIDWYYSPPRD